MVIMGDHRFNNPDVYAFLLLRIDINLVHGILLPSITRHANEVKRSHSFTLNMVYNGHHEMGLVLAGR